MTASSLPNVTCIIVNWNGWRDTLPCLDALSRCTYKCLSILVVDNGSTNDSIKRIKRAHPTVLLLESDKNLGFAGGNNIGMRYALKHGADYVWLLNNDTEPAPDALSQLVAKAANDRRIASVASVCYYADAPDIVQAWAGARVNLWIGHARNSTTPRDDAWFDSLYGASLLLASAALLDVGLLDEGFFHYLEETELCLRLRKKGWKLAAAPASRVLHKVGASTGGDSRILVRYFTASGLRMLRLHSPAAWAAMLLFLTGRFARRLFKLDFASCRSVWAGVQDYRATLPITQKLR